MWTRLFAAQLSIDILLLCLAFRKYVKWTFWCKTVCWHFCCHVRPAVCMWTGPFATNCLLTFMLPCLALSLYVNWTICCKTVCWHSCCHVWPSGSMWTGPFAAKLSADILVAFLALREYVDQIICCKTICWYPCYCICLLILAVMWPSGGIWNQFLFAKLWLKFLLPSSFFRMYVI